MLSLDLSSPVGDADLQSLKRIIQALVLAIAHNHEPVDARFEERDGRLRLNKKDEGSEEVYVPKILQKYEYTHDGFYCHGKMLHMVQGEVYVVESGIFLFVAGHLRAFSVKEQELVTELFYFGS